VRGYEVLLELELPVDGRTRLVLVKDGEKQEGWVHIGFLTLWSASA